MRYLYDDVTASDIPNHAYRIVAAYAAGHYENVAAIHARFPYDTIVTITPIVGVDADVIDCESGDATPAQAAAWAKGQIAKGKHPTIYTGAYAWPTVWNAVKAAGLKPRKDVSWWIAHYDGVPVIPRHAVAKQYLGSPGAPGAPGTSPGHYDKSVVRDYWEGVDPPKPKRTPLSVKTLAALKRLLAHLAKRKNEPTAHESKLLRRLARLIGRKVK